VSPLPEFVLLAPIASSWQSIPGANVPIYSPTLTQAWLRCPVYSYLKRTWKPPATEVWSPALLMGKALHAALKAFYVACVAGLDPPTALDKGHEALALIFAANKTPLGEIPDPWSHEALLKIALSAYNKCVIGSLQYPGAIHWAKTEKILQVDPGRTEIYKPGELPHADLLTEVEDGLIITDTKTAWHMEPKWLPRRLAEYDASFQLWFYVWRAWTVLQKPVKLVRVQHVAFTPTVTYGVVEFQPSPERVKHWLRGAIQAWARMYWEGKELENKGTLPTPNYESCYGKYGKCPFYDPCHLYHLDGAVMEAMGWQEMSPNEVVEASKE